MDTSTLVARSSSLPGENGGFIRTEIDMLTGEATIGIFCPYKFSILRVRAKGS